MQRHFAGLSRSRLNPALWATTKNSENVRTWEKSSLYEQPLHSRSYLLNFNLKLSQCDKIESCEFFNVRIIVCSKVISNFHRSFDPHQSCWLLISSKNTGKFAKFLSYLRLGWILTSWFMFCCQFWERKYPFSIQAAKHIAQELSYWQSDRDRDYMICFFNISSLSNLAIELSELVCICKQKT